MTKPATQGERLTRIETLLEADLALRAEERAAMRDKIDEMAADIKAIRAEVEADKADLAALKNKGAGILYFTGVECGVGEPNSADDLLDLGWQVAGSNQALTLAL